MEGGTVDNLGARGNTSEKEQRLAGARDLYTRMPATLTIQEQQSKGQVRKRREGGGWERDQEGDEAPRQL